LVHIFVPVTYKKKENKRKETLETFLKRKKKEYNSSLTTYLSVRIFVLATLQKEKKKMLEMFLKKKGIKLSIYLKKKPISYIHFGKLVTLQKEKKETLETFLTIY
jgi:hypothetical protein